MASQYSAHDRQTAGNVALICDDDPNVLDVLRPILTDANYKVVIASGCRQALEIAPHVDASVAIVDLSMPGGDGLETCAALRRLPNRRDVPMLILTSYQTDKVLRAAGTPGRSDFLCKPFVPSELLRRVAHAIGEEPGGDTSERMAWRRDAPGDAYPGNTPAIKARRTRKPVATRPTAKASNTGKDLGIPTMVPLTGNPKPRCGRTPMTNRHRLRASSLRTMMS